MKDLTDFFFLTEKKEDIIQHFTLTRKKKIYCRCGINKEAERHKEEADIS